MRRSIRWRLQAWYGLVLLLAIAGFAGILYYQVRAARFQEIDRGLEGAALYLNVGLRPFPPHELEGERSPPDRPPPHPPNGPEEFQDPPPRRPPPDPEGPRRGPPPRHLGPPPPDREEMLKALDVPGAGGPPGTNGPAPGSYFAVWRADGTLFKATDLPSGTRPPDLFDARSSAGVQLRQRGEVREAVLLGRNHTRILVGRPIGKELAELRAFGWQLAGAGVIVLTVGLAGGWWVSARILRPVVAISRAASAISAMNLAERIDLAKVDRELAGLAQVLNAMFARLEAAFERQARFTADASHELRTPLAIIRSHAELALARPRAVEEYRDAIEACLRASGRMTALVEGLLILARADAGKLELQRQPVDLKQVVEENVSLFRPLAEGKGVSLAARLAPARITGDALRLGQVVTNLLSNAVQYNRSGGAVHVQLEVISAAAVLSVTDTGCGIPEEDRPHLFERFFRVDKARARASGGNGLGLAICKSIVEAHGGTLGLETKPGEGSTFWARLPAT